jgi:predicted O-methyltransferase YrrM
MVHCVDSFTASGDAFSVPIYTTIAQSLDAPLRTCFDRNITRAGLTEWVRVHEMMAADAVRSWHGPIDMLYLDGDQSREGARETYVDWSPFLRVGGVLAINNSTEATPREQGHDGPLLVVREFVHWPEYENIRSVQTLTLAIKRRDDLSPTPRRFEQDNGSGN